MLKTGHAKPTGCLRTHLPEFEINARIVSDYLSSVILTTINMALTDFYYNPIVRNRLRVPGHSFLLAETLASCS